MRAITFYRYGPPSSLSVQERPVAEPGPGQLRIAAKAWALNAADWHILRADPWPARLSTGLFKPKFNVLGCDLAGVVEAAGPGATRFKAGDAVMGELSACGLGAFAERPLAPEGALASMPAGLSFEEAAAAPLAGVTALQALRQGGIQAGERVLIHGASGGVGTFALQLAKHLGANVTALCSPRGADLASRLGADEVIDYTREYFSRREGAWDFILACNGDRSLADYKRALARGGRFLMSGGSWKQMKQAMFFAALAALGSGKKLGFVIAKSNLDDLNYLRDRLAEGSVRSVIDRSFKLEQCAEALAYLEEGHARGKVLLIP